MVMSKRQNEIVDKAVRLVADRGMLQLTIKNIAGEMGISEPAIYRHFDSKFAILSAILDLFETASRGKLDEIMARADLSALDRIGLFVHDRFQRMAEYPPLAKVMFCEELFQDDSRLAERVLHIMHSHGVDICKLVAAGQASGAIRSDIEPKIMFRLIMGPVRMMINQWGLSNFAFDLEAEGAKLWTAIRKIAAAQA